MSRFTVKGWLVLPVALVLRIPFALLAWLLNSISRISANLARKSHNAMNHMPNPEYNQKWVAAENKRIHEEIKRNYING